VAGAVFLVATASVAGAAQAAVVRGTVVHRNPRARSFAVAGPAGHLFAIHAAHSPRPASVVMVSVRRLRNGTYASRRLRILAHHRGVRVHLRGTVSFVDRRHGTFTLSARGVSMLVRTGGGHRARVASALPAVGSIVTATGTVDGQEVELQVTPQAGGAYLLVSSSSDEGIQGANDQGDQQGNQGDQQGNQGDGQGSGGSGSTSSDGSGSGSPSSDGSSSGSTS
jgi:hypothetical protein